MIEVGKIERLGREIEMLQRSFSLEEVKKVPIGVETLIGDGRVPDPLRVVVHNVGAGPVGIEMVNVGVGISTDEMRLVGIGFEIVGIEKVSEESVVVFKSPMVVSPISGTPKGAPTTKIANKIGGKMH